MNTVRTGIRTTVVCLTSDDMLYRAQFLLSLFFNASLVVQFWIYRGNKIQEKKDKKE